MNENYNIEDLWIEIGRRLDANAMLVYLSMLKQRNKETNECNCSVRNIQKETGLSKNSVADKLSRLCKNGYLLINSGCGSKASSFYFPKEQFFEEFANDAKQHNAKRRSSGKVKTEASVPGIYLISNTVTHTQYVGQAVDVRKRWMDHIRDLRNGVHCNKSLQADFNQYGEESFEFKILETLEDSPILDIELDRKEGYWGKKLNVLSDGYNKAEFHDPFKE